MQQAKVLTDNKSVVVEGSFEKAVKALLTHYKRSNEYTQSYTVILPDNTFTMIVYPSSICIAQSDEVIIVITPDLVDINSPQTKDTFFFITEVHKAYIKRMANVK